MKDTHRETTKLVGQRKGIGFLKKGVFFFGKAKEETRKKKVRSLEKSFQEGIVDEQNQKPKLKYCPRQRGFFQRIPK